MRWLLSKGADPDAVDRNGDGILLRALREMHDTDFQNECVKLIEEFHLHFLDFPYADYDVDKLLEGETDKDVLWGLEAEVKARNNTQLRECQKLLSPSSGCFGNLRTMDCSPVTSTAALAPNTGICHTRKKGCAKLGQRRQQRN